MSFSSSNSDSSSAMRLPSFGARRGRESTTQQEIRSGRSPLASLRNSSRSRSRNRRFKKSNNDDYFGLFNPGSTSGFHSPPILEDDDELHDILADQPLLPSFKNASDPSTPNNSHDRRRREIEEEMDVDAREIFQRSFPRNDDAESINIFNDRATVSEVASRNDEYDYDDEDDEVLVDDFGDERDTSTIGSHESLNVQEPPPSLAPPVSHIQPMLNHADLPRATQHAPKQTPRVKFYNSSEGDSTEDDIKPEDGKVQQKNSNEAVGSSSSGTLGNNNNNNNNNNTLHTKESNTSERSEENGENFKDRLKKKLNYVLNEDNEIPDVPGEESFLNRIMKLGDIGGLVPGATKVPNHRKFDEEELVGDNIPLEDLDPDLIHNELKGIIKGHELYHNRNASGSTFDFYAEPDNLHEDFTDTEMNAIDGGDEDYVAAPRRVQQGVLSSLMRLYQNPQLSMSSQTLYSSDTESIMSGLTSPFMKSSENLDSKKLKNKLKKLGAHARSASQSSIFQSDDDSISGSKKKLSHMKQSLSISGLLHPNHAKTPKSRLRTDDEVENMPSFQSTRPKRPKKKTKLLRAKREATKLKITVHIADILQKQRFILRMCRALMLYGAPTHRLEEYMLMTARVLEIDGNFIYFPGVMLVSFGDSATRTSDVKLVRCGQGLNLSKLYDAHKIYKAVVHDLVGVEEASIKLDELLNRTSLYPPWFCVFLYGLGSAMVTSWGFRGGWRDMPISFGIGLCVGFLQFYVSPKSSLYSNVFEVTSSIVVSFLGRALGSINSGKTFCFGGIVQSSLALILPGYIILCGSLELQSRNMVAGSVRMFYAIIYSLFLGFGITLGAALYGWIDENATSNTVCSDSIQLSPWWRFLFVPLFTIVLGLINQARLSQLPVMIFISGLGYVVTYFSGKHFSDATEFTASIGAFVIGILGNLYSRVGRGMAVSAMLPAIFVQVPSGIASQSSLLSGVLTADTIVNNQTSSTSSDSNSLSFGTTMVEVAIGISVGLFAAAIVVYPLGKKRTGLFTL